jgi:glutamate-1-semialdehyde 2,1-aminomutase
LEQTLSTDLCPKQLNLAGKAISNGYPLSAPCGRRDIMRHLAPQGNAYFSGTYNGNVASVAAALATIAELGKGDVHERLERLGHRLCNGLNRIFENRSFDIRASNCGSLAAIHFMKFYPATFKDVTCNHDAVASANLITHLIFNRISVKPRHVPRFAISAAHCEADIDRTIECLLPATATGPDGRTLFTRPPS